MQEVTLEVNVTACPKVDHGLQPRIDLNVEKEPYLNAVHGDPRFAALVAHDKERTAAKSQLACCRGAMDVFSFPRMSPVGSP